jgi:hypothetical protein
MTSHRVTAATAVAALRAGDQLFALFLSTRGHLPDWQFNVADCDGERQTIVLQGPSAWEREVNDMDRRVSSGPVGA